MITHKLRLLLTDYYVGVYPWEMGWAKGVFNLSQMEIKHSEMVARALAVKFLVRFNVVENMFGCDHFPNING
jgi:hypothetical protein